MRNAQVQPSLRLHDVEAAISELSGRLRSQDAEIATLVAKRRDGCAEPLREDRRRSRPRTMLLVSRPAEEHCFPWGRFGLKSWDLVKAVEAWRDSLTEVYKKRCPPGRRIEVFIEMVDLERECAYLDHGEPVSGRWVRASYRVYC